MPATVPRRGYRLPTSRCLVHRQARTAASTQQEPRRPGPMHASPPLRVGSSLSSTPAVTPGPLDARGPGTLSSAREGCLVWGMCPGQRTRRLTRGLSQAQLRLHDVRGLRRTFRLGVVWDGGLDGFYPTTVRCHHEGTIGFGVLIRMS